MSLHFFGSDQATLGVELELQLIDPETMDLTPRAQEVLALCERRAISHVKAEIHQSMLEIDTKVASDVKECQKCMEATLSSLYPIIDEFGLAIGACGTHPFQKWHERLLFPNPRYVNLEKKFRWLAKRMNVYGLHVHIGVSDADKVMALSLAMYRFLPHLLALSANAPFWHGENTGMLTARPNILQSFPTGGVPPFLENWSEFEHYFNTLAKGGAIKSPKDLYWYIRPNNSYGTIEFRICDAVNSVSDIMSIVALIQNLVEWVDKDLERWRWTKEQHWLLPENLLIAARDGFTGVISSFGTRKQIADELYQLIEELSPIARSLNNYEELLNIKNILRKGNGAMHQRRIYAETGSLQEVVQMCTQELRSSISLPSLQK